MLEMLTIGIYVYAVLDYVFQFWGAINQARLYKQRVPLSTILLIFTRLIGRLLGIFIFALVFSFISVKSTGFAILYAVLVIALSGLLSILMELITRWGISVYVKYHASKIITQNKEEYGTGYTDNMK